MNERPAKRIQGFFWAPFRKFCGGFVPSRDILSFREGEGGSDEDQIRSDQTPKCAMLLLFLVRKGVDRDLMPNANACPTDHGFLFQHRGLLLTRQVRTGKVLLTPNS